MTPAATGGANAPALNLNIPLPPGATGDVLLYAFEEIVAPAVEDFRPSWVLISSGFDAHASDPLANLELSAGDFADLAARAKSFAPAPGRVVVVLEGGYDLRAISHSSGAVLAALLGEELSPRTCYVRGAGQGGGRPRRAGSPSRSARKVSVRAAVDGRLNWEAGSADNQPTGVRTSQTR